MASDKKDKKDVYKSNIPPVRPSVSAPTGLTATSVGSKQIILIWNANPIEEDRYVEYEVYKTHQLEPLQARPIL